MTLFARHPELFADFVAPGAADLPPAAPRGDFHLRVVPLRETRQYARAVDALSACPECLGAGRVVIGTDLLPYGATVMHYPRLSVCLACSVEVQ